MSRHNSLWLTKFPLERLQCILVHSPTVCKFRICCLCFAHHECFQIRQLHIIRKWCRVNGTPKLAYPLMPLQWISVVLRQFPLRKTALFRSGQKLSKIVNRYCRWRRWWNDRMLKVRESRNRYQCRCRLYCWSGNCSNCNGLRVVLISCSPTSDWNNWDRTSCGSHDRCSDCT